MPLTKQALKINFSGGVNTKDDAWQIPASDFLALNDMVFTTGGRLTKRNGFPSGSFTTTTSSPSLTYSAVPANLMSSRKVFTYNNELCLLDGFNLYSWDAASSTWNYKGRNTSVELATSNIVGGPNTFTMCDMSIDTTTGVKIYAFQDANGVYYSIQDIVTGQFIINQALLGASYTFPRCISISGKSWIFAINKTDGSLYYQAIIGQAISGSPTALISTLYTQYTFTVSSANATVGATYTNNGQTFTVSGTIASGTTLVTTGTGAPTATGTLTKATGTGDSTITFSAWTPSVILYDVDVDPNTGNIYLAYFNQTPGITIALLSTAMSITASISKTESATNGLSWFGDGTNIWVVYNNGSATKAFIVNNAVTSTTAAPTTIDSGVFAAHTSNNVTGVWSSKFNAAFIFYDSLTFTSTTFVNTTFIAFNTATLSGSTITPGTAELLMVSLTLNSKAFAINGIPHVVGLYSGSSYLANSVATHTVLQATNFLLNVYNITSSMGSSSNNDVIGNIAAKISPDEASQLAPTLGHIAGVHQSTSGAWEVALLQNSNYTFEAGSLPLYAPTGVIDCQFNFNLSNPDVQILGNNALIAGGQVSMYDGANVVEQNFHIYPDSVIEGTIHTTSGFMGLSGSNSIYSYIYVYEWIDNQGQVHRSFPSPVMTPLASGQSYTFASGVTTGFIELNIPSLSVTNKSGSQVYINIYRTVANGSVYYLIPSNQTGNAGNMSQWGTVQSNPISEIVTFNDGYADSLLLGQTQLYSEGALGYYAPPASNALTNFKNRAVAIASEDPYQIGYSNAVLQNFPVQFVPEFLQNIGTVGGPLIAVAQMDDKMILFKGGVQPGPAIYYMVGQGPSAAGTNNDFQDPLPIATDIGLMDRASIVLMDDGLMFKSNKGIYILTRGMQAVYIGAPVEAYNQYSVLSAQLVPSTNQVRFLISSGQILVYDYFYKKWCVWNTPAAVSDCIYNGQHTIVSSSGQVYQESPGTYVDGSSTAVQMSFTTAWLDFAGLQGYERAYYFTILANYLSAHSLTASVAYEYNPTATQAPVISPLNTSANTLEQWKIHLQRQTCQAFQITISETDASAGAGLTISGLNFIVGVKKGYRPIPASNSTG